MDSFLMIVIFQLNTIYTLRNDQIKASIEIALAALRLLTRNRFSVISYDITLNSKEYIVFVIKIYSNCYISHRLLFIQNQLFKHRFYLLAHRLDNRLSSINLTCIESIAIYFS